MVSHPLTNSWDYKPITVQCPCGKVMHVEYAEQHAFDHWDDIPRDEW